MTIRSDIELPVERTMSLKTVVVSGANRGIGLELVKQLLASINPPKHLIATIRQSNEELEKLKTENDCLHILSLDVKDFDSFPEFVRNVERIVGEDGVDTVINNAGIAINRDLLGVTAQEMIDNFTVNTVAPLMITKALLPLLKVSHGLHSKRVSSTFKSLHRLRAAKERQQ